MQALGLKQRLFLDKSLSKKEELVYPDGRAVCACLNILSISPHKPFITAYALFAVTVDRNLNQKAMMS